MASKEPWSVSGAPWKTEAAFWGWVRGVLRKGWSKHPIKLEYIKQNRKRILNPKPSKRFPEVWGMTCAICHKDVVQTEIEIDHISDTGGTFRGLEDVEAYVAYLFLIDFSSIRCVCKPCHAVVTLSQRKGITFEEARAAKAAIEFVKKHNKQEVLDFISKTEYNACSTSTAAKRRQLVELIFKESK